MAVTRGVDKWKLKKWYAVHAPKVLKEAPVGEMPANDDKAAVGRNIVVNLDYITHNPSHAYTNVVLKVTGVTGEAAQTKLVSLQLVAGYVRSFVRRYRSVSSAVVPVTSKDGVAAVVKLIAITRARAAHTKIVGIRKEVVEYTVTYFKETDMDTAINAIIEGKFQAELHAKLMHITDLNKVEVRKLEISN